jgi:predicted amidohydrolase
MYRIGYYQFDPQFGQVEHNLAHILSALQRADADLIVLPELALTGYSFADRQETLSLSEDPRRSPAVDALIGLCRARDMYLITGFDELAGERCYNSALFLGPEGLLHTYRKLHLFGTERDWFDPGDTPLQVHDVRGLRVGMMICFDWAFPEVSRVLALRGADVLCHPANLVLTYCQQTMLARCIENGVYAVTANRYGTEERPHVTRSFTGQSQIVAPKGIVLRRGPATDDELYVAEIDVSLARDKRLTEWNDILGDRRPEFYRELGY